MEARKGAWPLAALLAAVAAPGCTGEGDGKNRPVEPSELAGTWTGMGTFRQTIAGKASTAEVRLNLTFDDRGVPSSLPALGLVSPWRVYASAAASAPDSFPLAALTSGGTIWAYCPGEADGPANEVRVEPGRDADPGRVSRWSYKAAYRLADLIDYELYGYTRPSAPAVELDATDAYGLVRAAAKEKETLVVEGRATGKTVGAGETVTLGFDARLVRGEGEVDFSCARRPR